MESVRAYLTASSRNDLATIETLLTEDVEVISPLAGRMVFRGRDAACHVLSAVYGVTRDLRWAEPFGDGCTVLSIGTCRIGPLRLDDAMVFELADDGRIRRIRPHLRPWLATTLFALVLAPRVARRPAMVAQAARAGLRQGPPATA